MNKIMCVCVTSSIREQRSCRLEAFGAHNLSADTLKTNDVVVSTEKNGYDIVLPKDERRTIIQVR
jgi:hypothetical protein